MTEPATDPGDIRLRATFFRSITLVSSASAIILAGAEGILFPAAATPIFAIAGWILTEHLRGIRIPVLAGNLFGLIAFFVAAQEFLGGTLERKLLAGSHLVIYLTWIVLILPRGNRQYWWLTALSVLQLAIAGLLSGGVGFGMALLGMMLLLLWTMSVFSLFRVQDAHAKRRADSHGLPVSGTSLQNINGHDRESHPVHHSPETSNGERSGFEKESLASASQAADLSERRWRFLMSFLGLGFLRNRNTGSRRASPTEPALIQVRNGLQRDPSEAWVGWRFRGMVAGSYVVSVLLAMIVFAAFPRVWVPGSTLFGDVVPTSVSGGNRTGFSETVSLGDIGQIMQSNERVLAFDIIDTGTGRKVTAEAFADAMNMDEIRFRGNVLAWYSEGNWTHGFREKGYGRGEEIRKFGAYQQMPSDFRLNIVQDPPPVTFAFAPYPISRAKTTGANELVQAEISGSLRWRGAVRSENTPRAFTVECPRLDRHPEATFEFWGNPADISVAQRERLMDTRLAFTRGAFIMDGFEGPGSRVQNGTMIFSPRTYSMEKDLRYMLPRLYELANSICTDDGAIVDGTECIERIVRYLSNENGFAYSLRPERSDRNLDPVEDFVLNTKTGHCEYFASACTLMLQSVKVPARLVNGYYGCDINALTGKYEVRQRHAHAWVEAFVDDRWRTVEPTPSSDRQEDLVAGNSTTFMSNIQSAISDLWNDRIHQMSAERQQQFFAPVISTSKSLLQTIRDQGLMNTIRQSATKFVKSPSSWISWQGGVVSFLALLFAALLWRSRIISRAFQLLRILLRRNRQDERSARSVIRFYEGFCSLCERHGLKIPAANSALENAVLAADRFRTTLDASGLETLPARIAAAFNEVRFGSLTLSDEKTAEIGRDLQTFAETLKNDLALRN